MADAEERAALARLDEAVGELLTRAEHRRTHLEEARERSRELEVLLRKFGQGEEDPSGLQARIAELTKENQELRARVEKGREAVKRLLARIRFLEEQE